MTDGGGDGPAASCTTRRRHLRANGGMHNIVPLQGLVKGRGDLVLDSFISCVLFYIFQLYIKCNCPRQPKLASRTGLQRHSCDNYSGVKQNRKLARLSTGQPLHELCLHHLLTRWRGKPSSTGSSRRLACPLSLRHSCCGSTTGSSAPPLAMARRRNLAPFGSTPMVGHFT